MSPALLVHFQAHLDEDLSLDVLSAKASLSPSHFQRTLQGLVGETLKNQVARFRLLIHDVTLLDIALDCEFPNHETFTRAFRRRGAHAGSVGPIVGRYPSGSQLCGAGRGIRWR